MAAFWKIVFKSSQRSGRKFQHFNSQRGAGSFAKTKIISEILAAKIDRLF
jgi:hypothetical protein